MTTCCECDASAGYIPQGFQYPTSEGLVVIGPSIEFGCVQPRCGNSDGIGNPFVCGEGAVLGPYAFFLPLSGDPTVDEHTCCTCDIANGFVPKVDLESGFAWTSTGCEKQSCVSRRGFSLIILMNRIQLRWHRSMTRGQFLQAIGLKFSHLES